MKLDIYSNNTLSAHIEFKDELYYLTPVAGGKDLSLALDFSQYDESIGCKELPACLAQCLPEGVLRGYIENVIQKYAEGDQWSNELSMLSHVGRNQVGSLRVGEPAETRLINDNNLLNEIIGESNNKKVLNNSLKAYALNSGVSGAMPKVLIDDDAPNDKLTMTFKNQIVKFDSQDCPDISVNEYYCMEAARHSGMNTPDMCLSADRKRLIIERFDRHSFEELLTLQMKPSSAKYTGDYLSAFKDLLDYVSPRNKKEARLDLFKSLVLMTAVRNGDAHLKNYGVVYKDKNDVHLAPIYDVVTTTVFAPYDVPALKFLKGKQWPDHEELSLMGRRMGMKKSQVVDCFNDVENGVRLSADRLISDSMSGMSDSASNQEEVSSKIIEQWNIGLVSLGFNPIKEKADQLGMSA